MYPAPAAATIPLIKEKHKEMNAMQRMLIDCLFKMHALTVWRRQAHSVIDTPMKVVDLFSGCGGFSLGARQAGFDVVSSYDIDPILSHSYRSNFPNTLHFDRDIALLKSEDLVRDAGGPVSGIFGGPPCQGFSSIGKRDKRDPRRELLQHFFRLVAETDVSFFAMENVVGLQQGESLAELEAAVSLVSGSYRLFGPFVIDAADFGAATKRRRLFVIGFKHSLKSGDFWKALEKQKSPPATVRDAIFDLQELNEVSSLAEPDLWHIKKNQGTSNYARGMRSSTNTVTGNIRTKHTEEVKLRFAQTLPGTTEKVGRHPRLSWDGQCPTLRAGTGSDRGSFQSVRPIHPVEHRVITVREAARLQGFPDSFKFHPTIWHSFRMIGNSVSPFAARAVFRAIAEAIGSKLD